MSISSTSEIRHTIAGAMQAPPPPGNLARWFALGVGSNAWSLVFLSSAVTTAVLSSVWLAITRHQSAPLDLSNPVFDAFPVPSSQRSYLELSSSVFPQLSISLPPLCFYLVCWRLPHKRIARVVDVLVTVLLALTLALAIALVLAKQSFNQHQQLFSDPLDASVSAAFNDFYCNVRGAALCGETTAMLPDQESVVPIEKLLNVFNDDGHGSNTTLAMENVVHGCYYVFAHQYQIQSQQQDQDGRSSWSRQQAFLTASNTSDATDKWCGEQILRFAPTDSVTSIRDDENSPVHLNSATFKDFVRAWQLRFEFDLVLLGVVGALLLLFCCSWTKMLESDKRPPPEAVMKQS